MNDDMPAPDGCQIHEWRPDLPDRPEAAALEHDIDMLSDVLHAVVHVGAGVSFVVPFSLDEARAFWRDRVLPGVYARTRRVLVAHVDARIVGTVQLDLAMPPNQQHRAEVLTLDTWTGGNAEQLYLSLDYVKVGVIPRFARGSLTPALEPATFMYKELAQRLA